MLVDVVQCPVFALELVAALIACGQKSAPHVGELVVGIGDIVVLHQRFYLADERQRNCRLCRIVRNVNIAALGVLLGDKPQNNFVTALLDARRVCFGCDGFGFYGLFGLRLDVAFRYVIFVFLKGRNIIIYILPIIFNIISNM